jgi:hypothetical protein
MNENTYLGGLLQTPSIQQPLNAPFVKLVAKPTAKPFKSAAKIPYGLIGQAA